MRLDINLASQPYEDVRQFWRAWGTGLVLLGLLTLVLIFYAISGWRIARQDRREIAAYRAQIAEVLDNRNEAARLTAVHTLDDPILKSSHDAPLVTNHSS